MLDLIETRWEITMITTTGAKSDYYLEFCQFTSHAVELTALTDGRTVNDSVYLVVFLDALAILATKLQIHGHGQSRG